VTTENRLRRVWREGRPALDGWLSIGDAFSAEIMAAQGFDTLTVDLQHGALDASALLPMLQAMRAAPVAPLVRVPWREPGIVMRALDAGAMGIICPMVNTAREAAELVGFLRYPPEGQRSYGPTRAAIAHGGYGLAMGREVVGLAMIETAAAVKNLDAILATPGLDGVYVGPTDLAIGVSQGRLGPGFDREEPEMIDLIRDIAARARARGLHAGLHCGSADYAARAAGWGYDLLTLGGDARFLAGAAAASLGRFRALAGDAAAG